MKTLLLVAGGRGGSDFFHGLLDSHTQILTFPLYLRIDEKFIKLFLIKNKLQFVKTFIKIFPEFFDSRINKFERHDKLGINKNKYFIVNKKKFIKNYLLLAQKDNLSKFDSLKFLHLSYAKTKGENIKKKKILFIHTHLVSWTKIFIKELSPINFEIIHIIRHPIAALSSPIKNWLNFKNGISFFPKDLYFQIDLVFNGINELTKLGKVKIIKYEDLHWKFKKVMFDFCKIFKIKFEKTLLKSTKNGLLWWGDSVSNRWLKGINKNFKITFDSNFFFKRDLLFFQKINEKQISKYKYNFFFKKKNIYFNFFPMKCELLVWKNTIKHLFFNLRWKHFLSIPFFFFLRIIKINYLMANRKIKMPYCFGNK